MANSFIDDNLSPALVKRAAEGDDKAMARLIEAVMPAAKAKASRLAKGLPRVSDEDLAQEGMIGFLSAVRTFDPSKGIPFGAYANRCIENRILSAISSITGKGNIALTGAVSIETESEPAGTEDPIGLIIRNEEMDEYSKFIENELSDLEQKVVEMRIVGMKCRQIAATLGCTEKSVENAIQRVRRKYRDRKKQ